MITIEQMFEAFQPELKALIQQKVLSRQDASDIGSALARIAVALRAASPAAPEREGLVRRLVDLAEEWEQPSGENLSPQAAIIDFLHGEEVVEVLRACDAPEAAKDAEGPTEEEVRMALIVKEGREADARERESEPTDYSDYVLARAVIRMAGK